MYDAYIYDDEKNIIILTTVGGKMGKGLMSMAALAATSAAVDLSNHSLRGEGFQDAASPVRRVFPYEQ